MFWWHISSLWKDVLVNLKSHLSCLVQTLALNPGEGEYLFLGSRSKDGGRNLAVLGFSVLQLGGIFLHRWWFSEVVQVLYFCICE